MLKGHPPSFRDGKCSHCGVNERRKDAISHMIVADAIVHNDEVVGSIPTSSTKFSITSRHPLTRFCPKLVQNNFQRWVPGLASLQPRCDRKDAEV
jgi:hypothetical protein